LHAWLEAAAFEQIGGLWRVAEADLHVNPSEMVSIDDQELLFPLRSLGAN